MTLEDKFNQAEVELAQALKEEGLKERLYDIPLLKIVRDKKLQPRVGVKTETVERYAELYREDPKKLPPIKAFYESARDCYWVWDGWTRTEALESLGALFASTIPGIVKEGTREDAIVAAAGANSDHGEPRSSDDQVRAIRNLLSEVVAYRAKSDREISRVCRLRESSGHKQVARVYEAMVKEGLLPPRPEHREGRDGKERKQPTGSLTQLEEKTQTSLLISTPEQRTGPGLFDQAVEQRSQPQPAPSEGQTQETPQKEANSDPTPEPPSTLQAWWQKALERILATTTEAELEEVRTKLLTSKHPGSSTFMMQIHKVANDHKKVLSEDTTKPEGFPLHTLLGNLEKEYIPREGWVWEVEVIGKKRYPLVQALTLLPDAQVTCRTERDDEGGSSFLFIDSVLRKHLCRFLAYPVPKQATKNEGAEDSAPSKNGNGTYQDYNTPQWLIDLIRKVNPIIALDPFWNRYALTNPIIAFAKEHDGMRADRDWAAIAKEHNGSVYCNPPYERPLPIAQRAVAEAAKGAEEFLCLPTSHSTEWYKLLRSKCQAYAQLGDKVDFGKEGVFKDVAFHETTVFYFGPNDQLFRKVFKEDEHEVLFGGSVYKAPPDPRQQALPRLEVTPQSEAKEEASKEEEKEEETEEQWPSPWMDRALKSIEETTTQEDCVKVALPLIDKASTEEEVAKLKEVFEAQKAKLPHAENGRSPRPTTADNLLAVLLKCNYVAKGKEHLDAYKKKAPLSEHEELQKTYDAWRKSKPASTPYNRKNKPLAPAPKRNKGKNEEPIRGTIKKKAGKR